MGMGEFFTVIYENSFKRGSSYELEESMEFPCFSSSMLKFELSEKDRVR